VNLRLNGLFSGNKAADYQEGCKVEQVKIFRGGGGLNKGKDALKAFERQVNEWLEQNPLITITDRRLTSTVAEGYDGLAEEEITIAIFYIPRQ